MGVDGTVGGSGRGRPAAGQATGQRRGVRERKGVRPAQPGEFTKRAFLNGRLDLSQAEAVIDLIKAKTDKTFDVALDQLSGRFSEEINNIRKKILDLLVNVTVNIDYPDEDIEEMTYDKLEKNISQDLGTYLEEYLK